MAAATPEARSNPFAEAYTEFITLFANVLFAVSLFAVWGVLTVIGVIVDQGKDPGFYWQNYAPPLARLVLRLDLDNIYHSAAYVGIIGLILASLAVCTFKRVIPARLPPLRAVKIDKIPLHASVAVRGDEETVRSRVSAFFADRGRQVGLLGQGLQRPNRSHLRSVRRYPRNRRAHHARQIRLPDRSGADQE